MVVSQRPRQTLIYKFSFTFDHVRKINPTFLCYMFTNNVEQSDVHAPVGSRV